MRRLIEKRGVIGGELAGKRVIGLRARGTGGLAMIGRERVV